MANMQTIFEDTQVSRFRCGQSIIGDILDITPEHILIDLNEGHTGIVTKKEIETSEELAVGGQLQTIVIDPENDQGLVVLSLKRASKDMAWAELGLIFNENRSIKITIEEANKGGLMAKFKGIRAFLPVSQLLPVNYPRISTGESTAILDRLQMHVKKEFIVKIMNLSREDGKVIVSEKLAAEDQIHTTLQNIQVDDVVKGTVSGVVKFGIFVTFGGVEGLVHVSEMDWMHVSNPSKLYNVGDEVDIKIIGIDGDKLSFSIKQLSKDPWMDKVKDYTVGMSVSGPVLRWNDIGVFIDAGPDVQGLFSINQFGVESSKDLSIAPGDILKGEIQDINTKSHRLELKKVED